MNLNKRLKLAMIVVFLSSVCSGVFAESKSIAVRIAALKNSIVEAHGDSQISKTERDSLMAEWKKINTLYTTYFKDKKLSKSEKKALDSKIKKFDLNLFRKKYD